MGKMQIHRNSKPSEKKIVLSCSIMTSGLDHHRKKIVVTVELLIYIYTHILINRKSVITIQIWFNLARFRSPFI